MQAALLQEGEDLPVQVARLQEVEGLPVQAAQVQELQEADLADGLAALPNRQPPLRGAAAKKRKIKEALLAPVVSKFRKVAHAWNKLHGLRRGDQLPMLQKDGQRERRQPRGQREWQHANRWSIGDGMRFAWKSMHQTAPQVEGANHIGSSNNGLHTLTATAGVHLSAQAAELRKIRELCQQGKAAYVMLVRGFDCTPARLSFGKLTTLIRPHGRYLIRDPDNRAANGSPWKLVTADAYAQSQGKKLPARGIVEICGQRTEVMSGTGRTSDLRYDRVFMPPVVVSSTSASAVYRAFVDAVPQVGVGAMDDWLTAGARFVLLAVAPDRCPANLRMLADLCTKLPDKVLFWQGSCAVHMIHRIISVSISESRWCGTIYGMQFACSMTNNIMKMRAALDTWLQRELRYYGPGSGVLPDASWHRHQRRLVDNTLKRRIDRIRGRIGHHGSSLLEAGGRERLDDIAERLLWFCNGDWRSPVPEAYDVDGRFGSREKAARLMGAAIFEAGILLGGEGSGQSTCSVNRWGQFRRFAGQSHAWISRSWLPRTSHHPGFGTPVRAGGGRRQLG